MWTILIYKHHFIQLTQLVGVNSSCVRCLLMPSLRYLKRAGSEIDCHRIKWLSGSLPMENYQRYSCAGVSAESITCQLHFIPRNYQPRYPKLPEITLLLLLLISGEPTPFGISSSLTSAYFWY